MFTVERKRIFSNRESKKITCFLDFELFSILGREVQSVNLGRWKKTAFEAVSLSKFEIRPVGNWFADHNEWPNRIQ